MSFLTPFAFLGALFAIPIILLYVLRLRRRETIVSSNFLWQQILQDREANTPWQRLRRNILMLLQLLVLAFLVVALMRPAQVVPTITASKTVVLLDASASMNATDVDGDSRFDEAKRRAILLLSDLTPEDEISVIRVAEIATPLVPYTGNLLSVRQAIQNAEPGQGRGDWETALTLAAAGARNTDNFSIIIISDGGIIDAGQLPENIPEPTYLSVGESASNLAITALASRTLPGQNPQLFAQIQNYDSVGNEISLLIRLDGEIWESISPTISAESAGSFIFDVDEPFTTIQAELVLDDSVIDYLDSDNRAYTVAGEHSTRRVLLLNNQDNIFLEEILRSLPNVQIFRGDVNNPALPSTPYDLYIFNNYVPDVLPDADMLFINPPSGTGIFSVGGDNTRTANIEIASPGHPLAAFLSVDSINLRQFRNLSNISWTTPIVTTAGGDIIVAGENRGRQVAILAFDLLDSDFPLQIAFPIFMSNVIEWATPSNIISGGTAFSTGDTVHLNPPLDAASVRVTLPDGDSRDLSITGDSIVFSETAQAGFYTVDIMDGNTVTGTQSFAVNLFGTGESDIAPVPDDALFLGGGQFDEDAEEQFGFREWWQPVLLLALIILLIEWVIYVRRMRIPTEFETDVRRSTARR